MYRNRSINKNRNDRLIWTAIIYSKCLMIISSYSLNKTLKSCAKPYYEPFGHFDHCLLDGYHDYWRWIRKSYLAACSQASVIKRVQIVRGREVRYPESKQVTLAAWCDPHVITNRRVGLDNVSEDVVSLKKEKYSLLNCDMTE